jgi:hypothetical protein
VSWRDAPLYVESHDLARWLLERSSTWSNGSVLGERVGRTACELVESVGLALTFPARRAEHLEAADGALVRLRCLLRLAQDSGQLSPGGLRYAAGRLQAAGRMVGGWRKRVVGTLARKEKRTM